MKLNLGKWNVVVPPSIAQAFSLQRETPTSLAIGNRHACQRQCPPLAEPVPDLIWELGGGKASRINRFILPILFLIISVITACQRPAPHPDKDLRTAFESALRPHMMEKWFPTIVDTVHGGYLSTLDEAWNPIGEQNKMIVTQARHLWSASQMAMMFPEDARYAAATETGFLFLKEKMWDTDYGGFYNDVNRAGEAIVDEKRAYGNAFAIFGLVAYYQLSKNEAALELAKETFQWLDKHSYDAENLGYFPFMTREGNVIQEASQDEGTLRKSAIPYKDQNPTIHLLEAFTDLYHVWPDSLLRERLTEQLTLVRDVITHPDGYMHLYFQPDWTVLSFRDSAREVREANYYLDHVSFGHDVETAYLMLEACEVLGEMDCEATLFVGKNMLDHSLAWGFDQENGGFYERGYYFAGADTLEIIDDRKNWWAQAEGLHTLLLFSQRFPENDQYPAAFDTQWTYIQTYLMDSTHGGWYSHGLDTHPESEHGSKANIWKGSYHNGRSLMRCMRLLEGKERYE